MTPTILIGEDEIRSALKHAKTRHVAVAGTGHLFGTGESGQSNLIERVWGYVEAAVLEASEKGIEAARGWFEKIEHALVAAKDDAGIRAELVRNEILQRLQAALSNLVGQAVKQCFIPMEVDGEQMQISEVLVGHTIMLSGSVTVSLNKFCEFVSQGTLSVSAKYVPAATVG